MEEEYIHRRWFIFGVVCTGLTGLLCGLLIGFQYGYTRGKEAFVSGSAVRVDTVRDTVKVREPMAADSTVTGVIRVPVVLPMEPDVPKAEIKVFEPDSLDKALHGDGAAKQHPTEPSGKRNGGDNGGAGSETQERGKIARKDTVFVTVPRTQKRYEDSTYTAWVSGYEARLDSVHVYRRTVTRTVIVSKKKNTGRGWLGEHFGAGLVGGAGYGLTTKRADVFVGVGGWIRIF